MDEKTIENSEKSSEEHAQPNDSKKEPKSVDPTPPLPRVEKVDMAVKFLIHKDMLATSLTSKKAFLKKKGLTNDELEEAILKAEMMLHQENVTLQTAQAQRSGYKEWAAIVALCGGAFYGIYHVYKSLILPFLTGDDTKLEDNLSPAEQDHAADGDAGKLTLGRSLNLIESIDEKLTALQKQTEDNRKTLADLNLPINSPATPGADLKELKEEIQSIKKLLLSKSQFPAVPVQKPIVPSWQLQPPQNPDPTTSENTTEETPGVNGDTPPEDSSIDVQRDSKPSDNSEPTSTYTMDQNSGSNTLINGEVKGEPTEAQGSNMVSTGEGNVTA